MHVWNYAHHAARIGEWQQAARDRLRFKKRIAEFERRHGSNFTLEFRENIATEYHLKLLLGTKYKKNKEIIYW